MGDDESRATAPSHQAYLNTRFFSSLDGLRCLCIAAVLWNHSPGYGLAWPIAKRGYLGVDMFFVLSGFLIVTLLLRERDRHGSISLRNFYVRRTLRIFPIYYAYVLAIFVAWPFLDADSNLRAGLDAHWWNVLTFTANYATGDLGSCGHLWSLSIEEQFYLLWPFLEVAGRRWVRPVLVVALLACVVRDLGVFREFIPWLDMAPFTRAIVWGVALAHVLHDPRGYALAARILGQSWSCLVVAAAIIGILMLPGDARYGVHIVVTSVLFTLLVGALVIPVRPAAAPLLRLPPIAYIGRISYGIYLYHLLAGAVAVRIAAVAGVDRWSIAGIGIYLGGLFLVSALSFEWYERRFLRLRDRYSRTRTGAPHGGTARSTPADGGETPFVR